MPQINSVVIDLIVTHVIIFVVAADFIYATVIGTESLLPMIIITQTVLGG
jgi:LytS/YehU family sensor histidine kinase